MTPKLDTKILTFLVISSSKLFFCPFLNFRSFFWIFLELCLFCCYFLDFDFCHSSLDVAVFVISSWTFLDLLFLLRHCVFFCSFLDIVSFLLFLLDFFLICCSFLDIVSFLLFLFGFVVPSWTLCLFCCSF